MSLSEEQIKDIEEKLKNSIRKKLQKYSPKATSKPFHTRLLGKDRLDLYAFIHSLNTNFGNTIFEPVALTLAQKNFEIAKSQVPAGNQMSATASQEIQSIMDNLVVNMNGKPNKSEEISRIRAVSKSGKMCKAKPIKVDLMLQSKAGEYFLFDIKTAKPNKSSFIAFKRTLLEWVAVMLADNPEAQVNTLIAIPYNPYDPNPYDRWTLSNMLDLERELKVAGKFWNFLSGEDIYDDLLGCFERVGIELKDEINDYFSKHFQ